MRGKRWLALVAGLLLPVAAVAGGPRFVTGPPFFTGRAGVAIGWRQTTLRYYTDPAALSTSVTHQQADAIVAAAAGVWNLPVANITVQQGGTLLEHVSGQNVYMDTSGLVFPADAMAANAAAVPLAIVYDSDGSVTDLLLGSGASGAANCRQNGVTESVDAFDPAGYILHALIVVNGRCAGQAPQQQLQLQYQLERAFGRVLGLAWSQTNDNVFTGTPAATYDQAMHWPIMHPIDILCGPYTYQCLPNPFQLRPDDISAMVAVYPIGSNTPIAAGKQMSLAAAQPASGHVYFPTGEGMAGVNVQVKRKPYGNSQYEGWYEASAVTGATFRAAAGSPFVANASTPEASFGTTETGQAGAYAIAYIPIDNGPWQNDSISTEPVNPLYAGQYSLGPYAPGDVAPSGSPQVQSELMSGPMYGPNVDFTVADAVAVCGNGSDGTPYTAMAAAVSGWWNGLFCGYGHASYVEAPVSPGRSFTIEVTALDEQGLPTTTKAMPVLGLFAATDAPGDLPSLGVSAEAFQGQTVGTTVMSAWTGQASGIRFGIADERGEGRPDFNFQARLFYADNVLPATLSPGGGTITVNGMGFRKGNAVTVNGVAATVLSWTANAIVVTAPTMATAKGTNGTALDVEVHDLTTGATSTISGGLTYTNAPVRSNTMRLVSAQSADAYVGDATGTPISVQVLGPDGLTPVPGESVVFSAAGDIAVFSACGAATCTLLTDAHGVASSGVTPSAPGLVRLQAADGTLSVSASFNAVAQAGQMFVWLAPSGSVPIGVPAQPPLAVVDKDASGTGLQGRTITFSVMTGSAIFEACGSSVCSLPTEPGGVAKLFVTPTAAGPVVIQAADGDVKQTISFLAVGGPDRVSIVAAPAASVYAGDSSGSFEVQLLAFDGVTPDIFENVTFTAAPGVLIQPCGTNACTVQTGWSGTVSVGVSAAAVGSYSVTATYQGQAVSAAFQVVAHTRQIKIVSVPTGDLAVGIASSSPFVAQLLEDGVTPVAGVNVALAAPEGYVWLNACPQPRGDCFLVTDANGMVASAVTALAPGTFQLSAVSPPDTMTASITAVGPGRSLVVTSAPDPSGVWVGDHVTLGVQVLAPGGQPMSNDLVMFSVLSGNFVWDFCQQSYCTWQTDGNGVSSPPGTAFAPGPVVVLATDGLISQTFTFMVRQRPDELQLVSAPGSGTVAGSVAAAPFSVRVLLADGVTVVPSHSVTVSVTSGSATLAGCGTAASCVLTTDANGVVSSAVTPTAAGPITVAINDNGVQQTETFTAAPVPADLLTLAATPEPSVFVGATSASPMVARVTLADGTTPAAGIPVTFSAGPASAGAVLFSVCGAASCTVTTDASGMASILVTGASAGTVKLVASAALPTGAKSVTADLQVVANQLSLTALNPMLYVAEGAILGESLSVAAIENGSPALGLGVAWQGSTGLTGALPATETDGSGTASAWVTVGPLAAGATASAAACAWSTVCAPFSATAIALASLSATIVSGGSQTVSGGAALAPMVIDVSDGAGHPVAGAPVSVYQTVTAWTVCPDRGRCPAAAVLASNADALVSGMDGTVTITPLAITGQATETEIAVAVGTQGFVSAVLTAKP